MIDLTTLILKDSYTKPEALRKLRLVRELVSADLFGGKKPAVRAEDQAFVTEFSGEGLMEKISRKDFDEAFDRSEEEIKAIEPLVFYTPFVLPGEEVAKLVQKLRADYGSEFVIEEKADPKLIGGCALSFKGIYKDYSLRAKLSENREKLERLLEKHIYD